MTDERLCSRCGDDIGDDYCIRCDAPVEAAPSTDEGERGNEFPVGEGDPRGKLDSAWVKVIAAIALGDESIHRYRAEVEAAIRAPLEEERDRLRKVVGNFDLRIEYADRLLESARWRASRAEAGELRARDIAALLGRTRWEERKARLATEERIRDLQRWAEIDHANLEAAEERIRELEAARDRVRDALPEMLEMAGGGEFLTGLWAQRLLDSHNRAKDAEAENERLREALRDTATHLNMASLVVDTALLPSPPSSTEGTE